LQRSLGLIDHVPPHSLPAEWKEIIDALHEGDFLWPEECKLMHKLMMVQEAGFAWNELMITSEGVSDMISSHRLSFL
jgi:hypothetical protein